MAITLADTSTWFYGPAGGKTAIPAGETILTDTLFIDNQFGPVLTGQGQFLSGFRWQGPPDRPVLAFRNCSMADVGNFYIRFDTPALDAVVVSNLQSLPSGTVTTSKCRFHDIWIEGSNSGNLMIRDGIRIDSGYFGGPDQNNEYHEISRCRISGFSGAAVSILSSQSHRNTISDCEFYNSKTTPTGIGVNARYSSSTVERCKGGNLTLFYSGQDQYAGVAKVIGNNVEGCARFVDCRLPSGQWIIEDNRCDGMYPINCGDGDYNNVAAFCHANGYTSFRNNFMASQTGVPVRVLFQYCNGLNFVGNRFNAGAAGAPHVLATSNVPFTLLDSQWYGNTWQSTSGVNTIIPHP